MLRCPDCGSTNVEPTVTTFYSTNCRCREGSHRWREERTEPPPDHPLKRRKTDRREE